MKRDEIAKPLARLVHRPSFRQSSDFDGEARIFGEYRGDSGPAACRRTRLGRVPGRVTNTLVERPYINTHRGLRCQAAGVYQFNV